MPSTNRKFFSRKAVWITIAILLLIIIVLTVLLLSTINANRTLWPDHIIDPTSPPASSGEGPRAMRYNLSTAEEAQAYFQRLLDSRYIGMRGDVSLPAERIDGLWHLCEENNDGTSLTAEINDEGLVYSLHIGTDLHGAVSASKNPYTGGSFYHYVRAFASEYLPDIAIISGMVTADEYNAAGRYVTYQTATSRTEPAHEFIIQVDPEMRVIGFRLLADEADAFIRTSRMAPAEETPPIDNAHPAATPGAGITTRPTQEEAVEIARAALIGTLNIPADEVAGYTLVDATRYSDLSYFWYDFIPTAPYWKVSFLINKSDGRVLSDYDVIIDAATGEVLRIFDPSNNFNGRLTFLLG